MSVNGYVIIDREHHRRYIDRVFKTRREAEWELASLLKYYPPDHEWCKRLHVAPSDYE